MESIQLTLDALIQETKQLQENVRAVEAAILSADPPDHKDVIRELISELRGIREALEEGLGLWRT